MSERWQADLLKLRAAEPPSDVWERVLEGPRFAPLPPPRRSRMVAGLAALTVVLLAGLVLWRSFVQTTTPLGLGGPDVVRVPPRGEAVAVFLPDGRPIFIVHHESGDVSVVDAFSTHRPHGMEELVGWCPTSRTFNEPAHAAMFDEGGNWIGGAAPEGLATFSFEVVERGGAGEPKAIRVTRARTGTSRSAGDAFVTPEEARFCWTQASISEGLLAHRVAPTSVWTVPREAVATAPRDWIAIRGTFLVDANGSTRLCREDSGAGCKGAAEVRGIDGRAFVAGIIKSSRAVSYRQTGLWLARVDHGALFHLTRPAIESGEPVALTGDFEVTYVPAGYRSHGHVKQPPSGTSRSGRTIRSEFFTQDPGDSSLGVDVIEGPPTMDVSGELSTNPRARPLILGRTTAVVILPGPQSDLTQVVWVQGNLTIKVVGLDVPEAELVRVASGVVLT